MGERTVVESYSKYSCFLKIDVVFDFFWNSRAVFAKKSGNAFKTIMIVKFSFDSDSGIQC